MTHLCVSIFVRDIAQAKRDIATAIERGADAVELRIDELPDADAIRTLIGDFDLPFILTCRPVWEGGQSTLDNSSRLDLLSVIAPTDDSIFIDLEQKTIEQTTLQDIQNPVISSTHDFKGRPERLHNLVVALNESRSTVNKIVWTARTLRDNIEAFEILRTCQKPTIALCMGESGLISRVLAKKFGAFLTFASLDKTNGTAAGQVPIADMKNLYRWDAIGPQTKVYGVVAQPVAHSMSPALHNAGFTHVGHDGVYLPLLVEGSYESFKAFMETFLAFEPLHLSGLSVTLPHKENALRYLQEKDAAIEDLAVRIGALNTIIIERDAGGQPKLRGINTDYAAILDSITHKMKITREQLANYRVGVIGAGGTGRTAVAALAHYGATVVVYNRTKEKADALAAEFDGKAGQVVSARMEKLCDSCCHIFINTTNVGMHPNVNESPLGDRLPEFSDETVVFDTIYNPLKTKLLQQAEAAGAKTICGIEMFIRQAASQFQAWTGKPAPTEIFRQILTRRLG